MNPETKNCKNCSKDFQIEPEDFAFYEKINVPPPTLCPDCRYQRRLTNRNEWTFYRRPCDLCAKDTVTIHKPEYPGKVYCNTCWYSDTWNPLDYGREFDFTRPFFEQFKELRHATPRIAMANTQSVNSEYTNQAGQNKNCYLCVASNDSENCMYSFWCQRSRDSVDSSGIEDCELVYEGLNLKKCSRSAFVENCTDCTNTYFSKDLRGCTDCFGCYGLRGKSYCWFNEQLTKEEYQTRLNEFVWSHTNIKNALEKMRALELTHPHKYYTGKNNLNPIGDYLEETKNTQEAYNCRHTENLRHSQDAWWSKDSYDLTEVFSELSYENEGCIATRSHFVTKSWYIFDSWYSDLCFNSNNLFGCMSLQKKEYCILNKQYTKEAYLELLPKIKEYMKKTGEFGEFFPASISAFAYNETVAQDYFPLTKEEAESQEYSWYERKTRSYATDLTPDQLPKTIKDTDDSILEKNILCKAQTKEDLKKKYLNCTTAFRITRNELDFYRKLGIPIPELCFQDRRQNRLGLRNPRTLYKRTCECEKAHPSHQGRCQNDFKTTYAPEKPEILYCEPCYQIEVA